MIQYSVIYNTFSLFTVHNPHQTEVSVNQELNFSIVVFFQHPDINLSATDNDGLTALSVAMEAGHRDIGVLLYANM